LFALVAVGCAGRHAPTATALRNCNLTDGEIAAVADAIHRGAIRLAEEGALRGTSPTAREYAQTVIVDHRRAIRSDGELVGRLGLKSRATALSSQFIDEAEAAAIRLGDFTGPTFDRAYLDAESHLESRALQIIDDQLLPNAQEPAVQALLQSLRNHVSSQQQRARIDRTTL